ncbi:hypothetical protein [Mycobacterium persicum]|uniref:Uncharacterized protein n=1 Tax=Mycobacterium persicum TaxID=1487726 RepID=A0AB38UVU5_9MYCO|nr:hypothetical protein [Mycobacterium persicum]ORB88569.1 hypothetical protein B1T49_03980 [Mycobacterium persicum]VAZ84665.1 hypothetical protein LAUMK42_03488 [Mycobacterium persicum]
MAIDTIDRRPLLSAGMRRGRDVQIVNGQATAEIGAEKSVVEIDADGRLAAHVAFDLDDFDVAIEELETRYLAGEAAAKLTRGR